MSALPPYDTVLAKPQLRLRSSDQWPESTSIRSCSPVCSKLARKWVAECWVQGIAGRYPLVACHSAKEEVTCNFI